MNLLMFRAKARVVYIALCEQKESHPRGFHPRFVRFLHCAWGAIFAYAAGAKSTTREAPQEVRATPWGTPALKEGGLR